MPASSRGHGVKRLAAARPKLAFIALLLAVSCAASCGGDGGAESSDGKIKVVTSLPLFADFVRNIGGDRVEVTSILPLGADPHTFEPSPRDVEPITKADIAFANGLDLEPALIGVLEANLSGGAKLVKLGEQVKAAPPYSDFDPAIADTDPHLWMDYRLGTKYGNIIMTELNFLDVPGAASYKENYERYLEEIMQLGTYFREKTTPIAPEKRKLVTAHEAFDWFARSIGFEAVGAVAESPGKEPSPNEVAELTASIEEQKIPAVFSEPQAGEENRILKQAAKDAGVQVCTLYSDSLDDNVSSYIKMMQFNANELERCLGNGG
jgi:ABC-type Zn uptake system ZnuABC Zn-binding protein ZnuA